MVNAHFKFKSSKFLMSPVSVYHFYSSVVFQVPMQLWYPFPGSTSALWNPFLGSTPGILNPFPGSTLELWNPFLGSTPGILNPFLGSAPELWNPFLGSAPSWSQNTGFLGSFMALSSIPPTPGYSWSRRGTQPVPSPPQII